MDKVDETNSSTDFSHHTKDSSSAETSRSSEEFSSDATMNNYNPESDQNDEIDDEYELDLPSTSKDNNQHLKKITKIIQKEKPSKKYREKKTELEETGIKVKDVKEWIEKKVLITGSPRKDRNYSASYWKTCMRFLYWVDDHTLFEDWYHCIICGWTHNVILTGGTKVLKSHADSHTIEKQYEFTREELVELLARASACGQMSAKDFDKFLPTANVWRTKGASDFWNSIAQHSKGVTERIIHGTSTIADQRTAGAIAVKSNEESSSQSKGRMIRAKADAIAGRILIEANSASKPVTVLCKANTNTEMDVDMTVVTDTSTKCSSPSEKKIPQRNAMKLMSKSKTVQVLKMLLDNNNNVSNTKKVTELTLKNGSTEKTNGGETIVKMSESDVIRAKADAIAGRILIEVNSTSEPDTVLSKANTNTEMDVNITVVEDKSTKCSSPSEEKISRRNAIKPMPKSIKEKTLKILLKKPLVSGIKQVTELKLRNGSTEKTNELSSKHITEKVSDTMEWTAIAVGKGPGKNAKSRENVVTEGTETKRNGTIVAINDKTENKMKRRPHAGDDIVKTPVAKRLRSNRKV